MKAIGRLGENDRCKGILLGCAQSPEAETGSRMAAWSALTRYGSPDLGSLVEANQSSLDALEPGFAARIQRSVTMAMKHKADMVPILEEKTWMGMEATKARILPAYSMAEPVALDDLNHSFGLVIMEHKDVRQALISSLVTLASKTNAYSDPWCIDSDLAGRLRLLIRRERTGWLGRRVLDEATCKAIEANL